MLIELIVVSMAYDSSTIGLIGILMIIEYYRLCIGFCLDNKYYGLLG